MKSFDVVLLTAAKYAAPKNPTVLENNILEEDGLVEAALQKEGLRTARIAWSDPDFDWADTAYVLIRTPWDYFERFEEYSAWFLATSKRTKFINSASLVHWNSDKKYLKELQHKGIPIPPTYFIAKDTKDSFQSVLANAKKALQTKATEWVLKPCIAAGAFHTYRLTDTEISSFETTFRNLLTTGDFMLQEFQFSIVNKGELSLMLINGAYTHAVLKNAKKGDFRVQDDYGGTVTNHVASVAEIALAKQVINACEEVPLYARVDLLEDNHGAMALAELEIFEPELWFRLYPAAATALATTIKERYFHETMA